MKRQRRIIIASLGVCFSAAAVWALVWWLRYPKIPDVANVELKQAMSFLTTDDFLRLTAADRKKYVKAVAARYNDVPFKDLVGRMFEPEHRELNRAIANNLRKIPEDEQLGAPFLELFLDKFYRLTPYERQQYLTTIALAQQAQFGKDGDSRLATLRDPARFQTEMSRFMSRTTPQLQAKMGQFMLDLKRTRNIMGLKDPA